MKKNFLTFLTLALVIVNLVLTVIMAVAIVPETKKANELITKIADAIDLDMQSGDAASTGDYDIAQLEDYPFTDSFTVNLKKGEDGKDHYVVVGVTLSINKEYKDYNDKKANLEANKETVKGRIVSVLSSYTYEEFRSDESAVKLAILQAMQDLFGKGFVVNVEFSNVMYQ
ncbi:MAG: flagellar basal body-associated FliL family protein [Lachnospiraceae bacterium]|nr:flagellar basal body-associated FliL family protein [Lachnospiraceae bacterium]